MQRVLALALTKLAQLDAIGRGAPIFRGYVVVLFATGAFEGDNWSNVFSHTDLLYLKIAEPRTGFEPVTSSLPWMRSTD